MQKLVLNKYWQYHHSHYDNNKKTVYTFKSIPLDSLDEVALYFEPNGQFKEVVNTKKHPKPARNGKWHVKGDTLVLDFPKQRWNYKILFMSQKEFQCTMSN
jgi:hypothetical protein